MDSAAAGAAAISSGDFTSAINHYTNAISINPQAVDYYIKRSVAYTRVSPANHFLALKDAELAVVLAKKRGKKELLTQSQLRRGIALFGLERWADAQQCFQWVSRLNDEDKSLKIWGMKVQAKLKELEAGDEKGVVSVREFPNVDLSNDDQAPAPVPEGVQTPANKIRHEWYQTPENVVVTLFAKGIPKDKAVVDLKHNSLTISFPLPSGSEFQFSLDCLYADIDETSSTSKIMSTKVEFTLKKVTPGQKWPSLEGTTSPSTESQHDSDLDISTAAMRRAVLNDKAPSYPTSSKHGTKNWDKVANELTKKPKKEKKEGEEEADEDDGLGDFEGGDQVNGFFQMLYKGADDDTKRAMMKSYVESNGTALSTNWAEVGKGKVECDPPDGFEAKKW